MPNQMFTREWRSRIGFGGLLVAGVLGVVFSLSAGGNEWLWLIALFGLVTTVGVAGILDSTRYTGLAFLITGTLAIFFAVGRTLVYRLTEPLAVVLLLLGIITLYRGTQYRQAV